MNERDVTTPRPDCPYCAFAMHQQLRGQSPLDSLLAQAFGYGARTREIPYNVHLQRQHKAEPCNACGHDRREHPWTQALNDGCDAQGCECPAFEE